MFTGEVITPELLANIGAGWGATAYNCLYASQEASMLGAVHGDGRLSTIPLNVFYEVVDPLTGRPVDPADPDSVVGVQGRGVPGPPPGSGDVIRHIVLSKLKPGRPRAPGVSPPPAAAPRTRARVRVRCFALRSERWTPSIDATMRPSR
jgi:phenylacetate-CoA ligase